MVFLQHPRERRVAFGTARMAHLALPNSALHVAADADEHPAVQALSAEPYGRTVVLFPSPAALAPEELPAGPPATLLVIDGTWIQARKMLARSAALARCPQIGFVPARPGRYRIRREPAAHCLSTIEAVVEVLGRLEGDPERFRTLLDAFERMVEAQLPYKEARPNPYRRGARRRVPRPDPLAAELGARRRDLVAVYAEANAYPGEAGAAEMVQLVAVRPASGARLALTIAPRRALGPRTSAHLEVPAATLLAGMPPAEALARWRAFVAPADLLCTWGFHAVDLLRAAGDAARPVRDLRAASVRRLRRRAGGVEGAAVALGAPATLDVWAPGRAGRRIAALAAVLARLST